VTEAEHVLPFSDDLEAAARGLLPSAVFAFIAGGAGHERTVLRNRAAFDDYRLLPRTLVDVTRVDTSVELFTRRHAAPLLVAPMGTHRLVHPDGEHATTRGASAAGVDLIASTASSLPMEVTAPLGTHPGWFQLYVYKDRSITGDLVDRAAAAGFDALCVTVDTPVLGDRRRDRRERFTAREDIVWANLLPYAAGALPDVQDGSVVSSYIAQQLDASLTIADLTWLVERSSLPVVVKGVLDPADADRCVSAGAGAVMVSNHGGRQLDRSVSSLEALPAVVEALGPDVPVILDGGIRDASDVVIALALGARAVTVGRPVLWALACGGADGVERFLAELRQDLERSMQVLGRRGVGELDHSVLRHARSTDSTTRSTR
jgi:4-hydroxymandelate oxidase